MALHIYIEQLQQAKKYSGSCKVGTSTQQHHDDFPPNRLFLFQTLANLPSRNRNANDNSKLGDRYKKRCEVGIFPPEDCAINMSK